MKKMKILMKMMSRSESDTPIRSTREQRARLRSKLLALHPLLLDIVNRLLVNSSNNSPLNNITNKLIRKKRANSRRAVKLSKTMVKVLPNRKAKLIAIAKGAVVMMAITDVHTNKIVLVIKNPVLQGEMRVENLLKESQEDPLERDSLLRKQT